MELEHGVKPVQEPAKLGQLVAFRLISCVVEQSSQPASEVGDLDVTAAHRGGAVGAAEDAGEHRVQLSVLGLFVGQDVLGKPPVHASGKFEGAGVRDRADGIGCGSYLIELGT